MFEIVGMAGEVKDCYGCFVDEWGDVQFIIADVDGSIIMTNTTKGYWKIVKKSGVGMVKYIERETLDELMENRNVRGDCKFCAKYERCIKNGVNRKGSHMYCWKKINPRTDYRE